MKKKGKLNIFKRVMGILLALDIVIWFIGIFVLIFHGEEVKFVSDMILYSSLIISIPIFLGMFGGLAYFIFKLLHSFLKNTSVFSKIVAWIIILGIINIFIGSVIYFVATPFTDFYNVDKLRVVGIMNDSLIIDYTDYNDGVYATIGINKPSLVKINEGDYIYVAYPSNNPKKMTYIINPDVGLNFIVVGVIMTGGWLYLLMIILLLSLPYNMFKKRKNAKSEVSQTPKKEKDIDEKSITLKKRKAKRRTVAK